MSGCQLLALGFPLRLASQGNEAGEID